MRKFKLDIDALKVEEFSTTGDGAEERGTVRGHDESFPEANCRITWNHYECESISGQAVCLCRTAEYGGETCDANCA